MRVALDLRRIDAFGVATYVRNVVRALAQVDREDQFLLIGAAARRQEYGELPANFKHIPFPHDPSSPRYYLNFRSIIRRFDCDVIHEPYLAWRPMLTSVPYVMTVHDLLVFFPWRTNGKGAGREARLWLTRRSLANATHILAVSQFTRNELVRLHGVPSERISVVHNAIDDRFSHGHATDSDRELIAQRYQVNYPFILYAGNIKPHKNVGRLIEAFSALKAELAKEGKFEDLKLIIIGDELSQHPELRRNVVRSGMQNDVRFLGFVPTDVLRIFYDAAKIFAFPSLYEGFGLPPLEAMAHGTPVVTSNISSLPEVVGNAAVLVNPENVFDIRRALQRVLLDTALRARMKERGYQQVQKFSWQQTAAQVLEAYRQVAQ